MRTILVNLPVRKPELSRALFTGLGLTVNPGFSGDKTACMVIDDNAFVMLIKQERFRGFIVGGIGGATAAEVLMSLPAESREGPVYGPACRTLMGASGISRCGNLSRVTRPLEGSVHDFIRPCCRGAWPLGGKVFEEKF